MRLLFLLLFFTSYSVVAQKIFPSENSHNILQDSILIFDDSLTTRTIYSIKETDFKLGKLPPFYQDKGGVLWLRFTLFNPKFENLVFIHGDPNVEHITLYVKSEQGFDSIPFSKFQPVNNRIYHLPIFVADLPTKHLQTQILYLKYQSAHSFYNLAWIETSALFFNSNYDYLLDYKFYLGVVFVLLFYSFLMFILTGKHLYLYYGAFILASLFLFFTRHGLDFKFLWYNSPTLARLSPSLAALSFVLTHFLYIGQFISIKSYFFRFYKYGFYVFVICFALLLIFDIWFELPLFHGWNFLIYPVFYVFLIVILHYFETRKLSFFIVTGAFVTFSTILFELLRGKGLIHISHWFDPFFLEYVLILDMFLFLSATILYFRELREKEKMVSSALSKWLTLKEPAPLQDENIGFQEESLSALNIIEAIGKAEIIQKEQNEFLKSIEEVNEKLILEKEVEFQDFERLFLDENECLKLLTTLKWDKGFICRRCGKHDWKIGADLFDRKCTSCLYNESVKVGTLYEGSKFSMVKAFYLTYYYFYHRDEKVNLSRLALLVDLRRKTVSDFWAKLSLHIVANKNYTSWIDFIR